MARSDPADAFFLHSSLATTCYTAGFSNIKQYSGKKSTQISQTFWNVELNSNPVVMGNLGEGDGNQDKLQ